MNRPCLEWGCPNLTTKTRCELHTKAKQRQRDLVRGTPTQRGYGPEYQRNRTLVLAGGPHPCSWGCGRFATTADHRVPLALGGSNDLDNLMPSCAPCNASRGSKPAPSEWIRRGERW